MKVNGKDYPIHYGKYIMREVTNCCCFLLPSGKRLQKTMERSTIFYGQFNYKWSFSIAMLNYQRVYYIVLGCQFNYGIMGVLDYIFDNMGKSIG